MKKPILYTETEEKLLPTKWCICGCCQGEGKSSAYLGAYTWDEMEEAGEEFIDDYFAGKFDRPCDQCGGTGKIQEPDYEKMSPDDAAAFRKQEYEFYQTELENRAEIRAGA